LRERSAYTAACLHLAAEFGPKRSNAEDFSSAYFFKFRFAGRVASTVFPACIPWVADAAFLHARNLGMSNGSGACPGDDETAGVNYSHRSPKGNRQMRRLLNQAANAAARTKGSILRDRVSPLGPALGTQSSHRGQLIWLILHRGVRYEERGPAVTKRSKQLRTWKMIRQLGSFGYRIEAPNPEPSQAQGQ
jgi:hypothetical protein